MTVESSEISRVYLVNSRGTVGDWDETRCTGAWVD